MSLLISGDLRLAKTSVAATDTNIREVSLLRRTRTTGPP